MKITFIGAGSTVFAGNVIGDCLYTDSLKHAEFALYDIDAKRLKEAKTLIDALNKGAGSPAVITTYLGEQQRKDALRDASFVVNAIQVGGYEPCTARILRSLKSTACGRPLLTPWASAALCVPCAPSL